MSQTQSIPYPSYTTTQRDTMTSSGNFSIGFKITNSTTGTNQIYTGSEWLTFSEAVNTIKAHRTVTDDTFTASTWFNASSFVIVTDETEGSDITLNADGFTFNVNKTGKYLFGGCVHYQNNSGGDKEPLVGSRILINGTTEAKCSQRARKMAVKDGGEDSISYNGTIKVVAGDTLNLQVYASDNTIEFISNAIFTNAVAYTLWFIRL